MVMNFDGIDKYADLSLPPNRIVIDGGSELIEIKELGIEEPKKTLFNKMIEAGECCDIFNKTDVKEALKEYIKFVRTIIPQHFIEHNEQKTKEIFGKELLE